MAHVEQFVALMNVYLQSFLQAEIELFRENLNSLQELNKRHKLFSKVCLPISITHWVHMLALVLHITLCIYSSTYYVHIIYARM